MKSVGSSYERLERVLAGPATVGVGIEFVPGLGTVEVLRFIIILYIKACS